MIGVILSSKYVEDELAVEFGRILPTELPLFNKPLLNHQLEYLEKICEKIYITLPEGYNERFDLYNLNILYMPESFSLFNVLKCISDNFEKDEELLIHFGDTIFKGVDFELQKTVNKNIFFVKTPSLDYKWGPNFKNTTDVPAGAMMFINSLLINLLNKSKDFIQFASNVFNDHRVLKFSDFQWLDFGHALSYYQSRQQFLETRYFNSLKPIESNYLRKESTNIFKMWCEYNWLLTLKIKFPTNIPFVTNFVINKSSASYDIEYFNRAPLSDVFVFGNISDKRIIYILNKLKVFLLKLHSTNLLETESSNVSNFIYEKLLSRKIEVLDFVNRNKLDVATYEKIVEKNLNYFQNYNTVKSVIHGDFCFSNIIFDSHSDTSIIIDPRGYLFENSGFTIFGPSNYDIFKLGHSFIAGYDYIIADIEPVNFFTSEKIKERFIQFNDIFKLNKVELTNGIINLFLSMIPLHADNNKRQLKFLNMAKVLSELW
jgi:hypothetical protein